MPTRVLLADDEPVDRIVTRRILETAGFEVVTATDGLEALAHVASPGRAPIAILDWNMPGADGTEICRHVRATPELESLYVILLTCRVESDDAVAGLDAGADDYIRKPVVPAELIARVNVGRRVTGLQARIASQIRALQAANARIQELHGLIPMCCVCKRIRNDEDYWQQVDAYLAAHSGARVTHGYCPECYEKALAQVGA